MKYLPLLLVLHLPPSLSVFSQELPFTHYTAEREINPLPSSNVPMTFQDRLGYMWFVVYSSGLVRYNGNMMRLYTGEHGLPGLDVRRMVEDSSGRLWIASEEGIAVSTKPLGEYEVNEDISFTDTVVGQPLLKLTVTENRMCVDRGGTLWVGTQADGIIRYRFGGDEILRIDTISTQITKSASQSDVRALCLGSAGRIWASLAGGFLAEFDSLGRIVQIFGEKDGIPKADTDVIKETSSGEIVGGTFVGEVWTLKTDGDHHVVRRVPSPLTTRVTGITEDSKGRLWISTEGSGVLLKQPGQTGFRHLTIRNGLLSDLVNHVMEDHEGSIWISQIGGVSKLRLNFEAHSAYTSLSREGLEPYLRSAGVNTVVPERKGGVYRGIWVATSGGGITFIGRNDTVRSIGLKEGLKSDWINGLALDSNERLWIGSSLGINCISLVNKLQAPTGQSRALVNLPQGRAVLSGYGYRNTSIYFCDVFTIGGGSHSVETVWFSAYQAIYVLCDERWYVFRVKSGLPETYFTSIYVDSRGFVWVGTRDAGLFRSRSSFEANSFSRLKTSTFQTGGNGRVFGHEVIEEVFEPVWSTVQGAPSNQIESLAFHKGTLWVGNPAGLVGLNAEDLSTLTHLSATDGLPGNDVTSLAYSPDTRSLWLGTNGGMAEVDPEKGTVLRAITKKEGLVDNEVWWYGSIRISDDAGVFFGTAKGLSFFDAGKDRRNNVPPVLRLELAQKQETASSNHVLFRFAALSFADENLVQYKTTLEGYEDEWSQESRDVSIRYTNLPAFFFDREYTFLVHARNNDGMWTNLPLSYSFQVSPPWWFRWWFMSLIVFGLAGLSFIFLHYRTLKLKQRSQELERIVEERTDEIRQKAGQISKQADELSAKNVELEEKNEEILRTQEQLIVQEKLASLGALTAGIAHEIKNPLNFVNNFSEVSVDIARELRDDLELVREKIDPEMYKRLEGSCVDLAENSARINEHGKRADGIVKGMLEHSRGQTGNRELTQINGLLDEYSTLAYHGIKAQDPDCNVRFEKKFDPTIGPLEVFPADLSRVFLNMVNNACYSVYERQKRSGRLFSPLVTLTTLNTGNGVEVRIRDNGSGMSGDVRARIFDPFFTTKPTGKGTGLGLSLSHDIIVKQHGGRIDVESVEGEFAEFRIFLPGNTRSDGSKSSDKDAPVGSSGRSETQA